MVSGVYCFKHKEEPFIYIGSSKDIQTRYNSHVNLFNNHLHDNISLMNDFLNNKLTFTVLDDYIPIESLKSVEQNYCEKYLKMGFLLYNKILPNPKCSDDVMLCSKKVYKSSFDSQTGNCQYAQADIYNELFELKKEISKLTDTNHNSKKIIKELEQKKWSLQSQVYSLKCKLNEIEYVVDLLYGSKYENKLYNDGRG